MRSLTNICIVNIYSLTLNYTYVLPLTRNSKKRSISNSRGKKIMIISIIINIHLLLSLMSIIGNILIKRFGPDIYVIPFSIN